MICPDCGAALPADAAFCLKCGARLSTHEATPPSDALRDTLERALGERYEITRLIGRGGMGAVYLAREIALDRLVAIKALPAESARSTESRERFRREARTAARLTHPNIVPLHTFGEAEGTMYFVMGYVGGESLADRLRRQGPLPVEETRRIIAALADALDYAHRLGVVHRDVKPDNVLLDDESRRAMLTDFGVAKAYGSDATLTHVGSAVGTPQYMSPEQAAGEEVVDGRSDLYSLGIVAYQMLSGRLPFEGRAGAVALQHVTQEPDHLGSIVAGVDPDLVGAVMRCLAKDPETRWQDGAALRDAVAPGASRDVELPESVVTLRQIAGAWPVVTAGGAVLVTASQLWGYPDGGFPWWSMAVAPVVLALGAGATAREVRREGLRFGDALRLALREPRNWRYWWPTALRRPDSIWPRLPKTVRRLRGAVVASMALMAGAGLAMMFSLAPMDPTLEHLASAVIPWLFGACGVSLYGSMGVAVWWGRRHGLSATEALNLLSGGRGAEPGGRFWRQAHIAPLLLDAPREVPRDPSPQQPSEYVRAIAAAARGVQGPARELAREALDAGRRLLDVLQLLDKELDQLRRDADPAEIERLEQRVQEIGGLSADDGAERLHMRDLLVRQLELARQLDSRQQALVVRRGSLQDLLRALWLQVANLRAAAADKTSDTEVTGRIRSLCADIARHAQAADDVEGMLGGP